MGGSAPTCPVLKGATYWEQRWLLMPGLFSQRWSSANDGTQGKKKEWPEKNASVQMTFEVVSVFQQRS